MARRTKAVELDAKWRERIKASMLRNRLRDHALGQCDMSPTQVRAAEILLRKVVPDLSAVQMDARVESRDARQLTDAELDARIAALERSAGTEAAPDMPEASGDVVH